MIKEIGQYLEDETSLVLDSTLFLGDQPPQDPTVCVSLLERTPGIEDPMQAGHVQYFLQILSRARDSYTARANAYVAYDALYGKWNCGRTLPIITSGGDAWYIDMVLGNMPASIGTTPDGRHQFSSNLSIYAHKL